MDMQLLIAHSENKCQELSTFTYMTFLHINNLGDGFISKQLWRHIINLTVFWRFKVFTAVVSSMMS